MVVARIILAFMLAATVVAGCAGNRKITASTPLEILVREDSSGLKASGPALANLLVCTDSLGRPMSPDAGSLCVPCVPISAQGNVNEALRHAGRLWRQTGKTPYDATDQGAQCIRLSYEFALLADSTNRTVRMEHALFQLASANDSIRALGLTLIDSTVSALLSQHDSSGAARVIETTGRFIWERAQRMLHRPEFIGSDDREKDAHELERKAPALSGLPPIPRHTDRLGISEARWASALFHRASQLVNEKAARARLMRLALSPYVLMADWRTLDSAASNLLTSSPRDSIALMARALATYKLERGSLANYPRIDSTFNEALRALPTADSAAYDNFDDVFSAKDDEWRYGFLPGIRAQLDRRAWKIVDPMWLTPVNELRLAKRARRAEADFRYADITAPGESGSETDPGVMLVKAGPPDSTWRTGIHGNMQRMEYGWNEYVHTTLVWRDPNTWRVFYHDGMTPREAARGELDPGRNCATPSENLVACARVQSASWREVLFYARLDTIDVSLARFRASNDSVDLHVGARIPLRGFRHRGMTNAQQSDSIRYALMIATSFGDMLYSKTSTRRLPSENDIAWFDDWTVRVGDGNIMHRVEAVDPRHARGARGAAILTSASEAVMHLSGFGLSDILVADKLSPAKSFLNSWRDLEVTPNGGVVAPRVPIALAWEIYDLARGPDGLARWRVHLKREDGTLRSSFDVQSLIVGSPNAGTQVIASEPDASGMAYVRTEPARPKVVEFLKFNLSDAAPGRHVLILTVEDLVAKRTTSRSVSLRILPNNAQQRIRGNVWPAEMSGFRLMEMPIRRVVPVLIRK